VNNGINDRHTHFFTFQSIGNVRCSSGLLPSNDCRLLYAGYGRIYQPTGHRCFRSVFVAALLILGGVELNLGPPAASMSDVMRLGVLNVWSDVMRLGILNVWSAVNKAAQVHDIIDSHNLDLLVLTETWFNGRLPPAVTDDVAPAGYAVVHSFRQNGDGGGVSIIYRHPEVRAATIELKSLSSSTDRLVLKLVTRRGRVNLTALYRPPSSSSYGVPVGQFCDEFANLLDELLLLPGLPIICGDFNCPGVDLVTVDQHLSDTLSSRDLDQVVTQPTHQAGNLLGLLITMIDDTLVKNVEVHDPGCSDHSLVLAELAVGRPVPCYRRFASRNMKTVDPDVFVAKLSVRPVCMIPADDVNTYADQLDHDSTSVLDQLAPTRMKTRCCGKRSGRWLSDEAV